MAFEITPRNFAVNPTMDGQEPLCIGLSGPPGAGKTWSALRLASGMGRVRGGKPVVIDTDGGRARKYHIDRNPDGMDFDYIPFDPPFIPEHFLDAIKQAEALNPSAIIVDNASNEHEGPGGVLEWHDRMVPKMGGNEWAAWGAPKASRRKLTTGIQQIKTPIILTFSARQKTKTEKVTKNGRTKDTPVNIGYMPIAGEEIVGIMDLFCLLPPRSNGVATWSSDKAGEDFVIKLPWFLADLVRQGAPLDEELGEALARWQSGKPREAASTGRKRTLPEQVDAYIASINQIETTDELREYQLDERRAAWLAKVRAEHPAQNDRIVEATSRRLNALTPLPNMAEDDEGDDDRGDDEDLDRFPGGDA